MKKFLLSSFVILAFVVYSLHQRSEGTEVKTVVPPNGQNNTQQNLPSDTPTTGMGSGNGMGNGMGNGQMMRGIYKDGTYTGNAADAFYGNIQVQAIITNGKISDVQFLQYPNDRRTSVEINTQAMPYLRSEAIQAQNAQVDIVSGATDSSMAFRQSLGSALSQAR